MDRHTFLSRFLLAIAAMLGVSAFLPKRPTYTVQMRTTLPPVKWRKLNDADRA
jgi:hypothetical protein